MKPISSERILEFRNRVEALSPLSKSEALVIISELENLRVRLSAFEEALGENPEDPECSCDDALVDLHARALAAERLNRLDAVRMRIMWELLVKGEAIYAREGENGLGAGGIVFRRKKMPGKPWVCLYREYLLVDSRPMEDITRMVDELFFSQGA